MLEFTRAADSVEAEQFHWGKHFETVIQSIDHENGIICHLKCHLGLIPIKPGDWIVIEKNGEKFVCSDDIFMQNYTSIKN